MKAHLKYEKALSHIEAYSLQFQCACVGGEKSSVVFHSRESFAESDIAIA